MFEGMYVAIPTPFRAGGGAVDEEALRRHVDRLVSGGVHGLVPCGTTGEAPTLSAAEWELTVRVTLDAARGRVPVVAGAGNNDTSATVEKVRRAKELGAAGALVVTPYYNKPTQGGLR